MVQCRSHPLQPLALAPDGAGALGGHDHVNEKGEAPSKEPPHHVDGRQRWTYWLYSQA
jgi:hypothetical protein